MESELGAEATALRSSVDELSIRTLKIAYRQQRKVAKRNFLKGTFNMIYNYSYKPTPRFSFAGNENTATTRTYGLEVEVDSAYGIALRCNKHDLSDKLNGITDLLYCKNDGSLGDHGVELVSHPCSLRFHMNNMRWKYIAQTCVKNGFRSHDSESATCGLHIHVGRAQLGSDWRERDETVRKIIVLVERYWSELVPFTRRNSSALRQWAPRPQCHSWYRPEMSGDEVSDQVNYEIVAYSDDHDDRYTAVNVTNDATIEFRIFRGTLKRDTLIAAIQLVDNICEYAMTHSWDDIQASSWEDVVLCKHWNELDAYMLKLGLVSASAVPAEPIRSHRTPDFGGADGIATVA